jgi:hypothetical protein
MLEEHWWGLAIPVSQIACEALPKPTWRGVLGEYQWRSSYTLEFERRKTQAKGLATTSLLADV